MRRSKSLRSYATLLFLSAFTLSGSVALPGCNCAPRAIDLDVELEQPTQQVRTLPILASGRTSLAGVDIPDSHGVFEWDTSFTDGRVGSVDVVDLQLDVTVEGSSLPITIVKVEGLDNGTLAKGERIRIWWTLDRNQVTPAELALDEGTPYQAALSFDWSLDSCAFTADGAAGAEHEAFIRPSIITTTFEQTSGSVTKTTGSARYEASAKIRNGVFTDIGDVTAFAIALGSVPGAVVWTQSTVTVNGLPVTNAGPGDDIEFSGSPMVSSGTAPWLLILHVEHQSSGNTGIERDTLAWLE